MDRKNLNGFLLLLLVFLGLLLLSGKLTPADLWPLNISRAAIRWRLSWMAVGAAIGFTIVWGKRLPPDAAFWGMIICLILAFLLF